MFVLFRLIFALILWPFSVALGVFLVLFTATLRVIHHVVRGSPSPVSLKGQCVVITGGAGGFGQAMVPRLLSAGAIVYAVDVIPEDAIRKTLNDALAKVDTQASATAKRSLISSGQLICVSADVTQVSVVQALAERVRSERGEVYCVINNAGVCPLPAASVEADEDDVRRVMNINFHAAVHFTREFYGFMRYSPSSGRRADGTATRSRFVNISSAAGLVVTHGMAAYFASKFALEAWSDATRLERADAIDVALVEPFFAQTGIVKFWLNIPDSELRKSCLGDQYIKAKRRAEGWQAGTKPIMSADFVADRIMRAVTDPSPQDRYMVFPNAAVGGVMALMMHLPNYFHIVDGLKAFLQRVER
jgi:NAD(P)-dependent dehydrogenase (short-subunit alcohol dehydrogenase family)